jgi:DNA-binding transcriptional LysR family regulator
MLALSPSTPAEPWGVLAAAKSITDNQLAGTIRVTCPTLLGYRLRASPLFEAFHARYPGLRVELVLSDQIVDLAKGRADIAIRASEPQDDALVGRKIAERRKEPAFRSCPSQLGQYDQHEPSQGLLRRHFGA